VVFRHYSAEGTTRTATRSGAKRLDPSSSKVLNEYRSRELSSGSRQDLHEPTERSAAFPVVLARVRRFFGQCAFPRLVVGPMGARRRARSYPHAQTVQSVEFSQLIYRSSHSYSPQVVYRPFAQANTAVGPILSDLVGCLCWTRPKIRVRRIPIWSSRFGQLPIGY
jgi:hypothetical protein